MKTYSGELKEGMLFKDINGEVDAFSSAYHYTAVREVYHNNEWHLCKPQLKKVWGIPELGDAYYLIESCPYDGFFATEEYTDIHGIPRSPVYLDKHKAEQYAEAMNYINEFRVLSDVPVDGVKQWVVDDYNEIISGGGLALKLRYAMYGYVANSREKAERDFAAFPKIALAHKIVTWGFHGIVEEVL